MSEPLGQAGSFLEECVLFLRGLFLDTTKKLIGAAEMKTVAMLGLAVLVCLSVVSAPVLGAGILPGHADAYSSGITPFDNGLGLAGDVEWAVFAPGDFTIDTGGTWAPGSGEMAYVYQVYSSGTDAVSKYEVPLMNPAGNIGAFEAVGITGIIPSGMSLIAPGSAMWQFLSDGIDQEENSRALVYSSPTIPIDLYSIVVNGGTYTLAIPVPSPGSEPIPEPSVLVLLLVGLVMVALQRFTRRM